MSQESNPDQDLVFLRDENQNYSESLDGWAERARALVAEAPSKEIANLVWRALAEGFTQSNTAAYMDSCGQVGYTLVPYVFGRDDENRTAAP